MIVSYEDRTSHFIGLKLLALSVLEHCSDAGLHLTIRNMDPGLQKWVDRNQVSCTVEHDAKRSGYDVKPTLLRRALEAGADEAIWLDSDIIVTSDPRKLWNASTAGSIAVAEEFVGAPSQGGSMRTREWGLPVGRILPNTTNSCIVRVVPAHLELLRAWEELLGTEAYRVAQAKPWFERPPHLAGDQDVLCALLGSKEFATVPIRWVRRGPEVAHCFEARGYVFHQRIVNLLTGTTPTLIHGQGPKPWDFADRKKPLYLELSPYALAASRYRDRLNEDAEWSTPQSRAAANLRRLFRDHLTASGLLPALTHEIRDQRLAKSVIQSMLRKK